MRFPIDITANDKTRGGLDQAANRIESRFKKLAKPSEAWRKNVLDAVEPFDQIHHAVDRLTKPLAQLQDVFAIMGRQRGLSKATSSASSLGKSLRAAIPGIGDIANDNGLPGAANSLGAIGSAAQNAAGGLAEAGEAASGLSAATIFVGAAAGGAILAIGAAGVAGLNAAAKWDSSALALDNLSKNLGISAVDLQSWKGAAEQAGVKADDMATAIGNIRRHANAAKLGQDTTAQAILQTYGISPQAFAGLNFNDQMAAVGAIVRRQKDAQMQAVVAGAFGADNILPVLRQSPRTTAAQRQSFVNDAMPLTQADLDAARKRAGHEARVKQALGGVGRQLGKIGASIAAPVWGGADNVIEGASGSLSVANYLLNRLMGKSPSHPAAAARAAAPVAALGSAFDRFAARIEKQESGGHQFDRHGRLKVSSKGAIGAMQLLPDTARRVARSLGEAFDPTRFLADQAYNERLGKTELARLYRKYGGDETLAAAAYNAGDRRLDGWTDRAGRHAGWLERFGDPRRGGISDARFASEIPFHETRDYVANTATPQKVVVEVAFANAPAGLTVKAHDAHGPVPVKVGHSQVGRG